MSTRNMRKIIGEVVLPPPDHSSDEEPVGAYSKLAPSFQGLEVTSDLSVSEPSSEDEEPLPEPVRNKNNRKKKKKAAKAASPSGSTRDGDEQLDEVSRSLREVNQLLGEPPPAPQARVSLEDVTPRFMRVEMRNLNADNEMNRRFGPDDSNKDKRRRRKTNIRLLKKFVVVPLEEYIDTFKPVGLTMSVHRKEKGLTFYALNHSQEYQRLHRRFLNSADFRIIAQDPGIFLEAQRDHHVEAIVECADVFFNMEDHTSGTEFIKQAVAYLQFVAHPSFLPTDATIRLEYAILENRVFHVAILKHLYLLTNRACHGTALELAKMLLNLDPTDPLAVLLIIDTLALRAWEHQWLVEAIEHWINERDAVYMYNLRFSYALAKFHVLTKNKEDIAEATRFLEDALLDFPQVCYQMLNAAHHRIEGALQCTLYDQWANSTTKRTLTDLTKLYCQMTWAKWKEPDVFPWFVKTCTELGQKHANEPRYQHMAVTASRRRMLYQQMPDEVYRHLCIIKPMSYHVAGNAVPEVEWRRSSNPRPPRHYVDRYSYEAATPATTTVTQPVLNVMLQMLASIDPRLAAPPQQPRDD